MFEVRKNNFNVFYFSGYLGEAMLLAHQSKGGISFGISNQIFKALVTK